MQCDMVHCPKLTCPSEQQVSIPDDCCKFCPGDIQFNILFIFSFKSNLFHIGLYIYSEY